MTDACETIFKFAEIAFSRGARITHGNSDVKIIKCTTVEKTDKSQKIVLQTSSTFCLDHNESEKKEYVIDSTCLPFYFCSQHLNILHFESSPNLVLSTWRR